MDADLAVRSFVAKLKPVPVRRLAAQHLSFLTHSIELHYDQQGVRLDVAPASVLAAIEAAGFPVEYPYIGVEQAQVSAILNGKARKHA